MAQVLLENLSKSYDGNCKAVDGLNLDIADEEFMVIVGPSGCGKTTTLRMIAGLEDISAGLIKIGDRVVNDVAPKDRDVAMVFQNYALYPHMTVYQNMAFGLRLRKCPKSQIRQRIRDAARVLDIENLLDRKPRALSGGQRQRVALGRAIVRDPRAFLFDEPLSNLDVKLRATTRAELKALHHRLQTTSIYVTHDQAEAMTLGDRISVMHNGLLQQVAGPMDIYEKPANRFVAGFLGNPPMNFIDGRIQAMNGRINFVGDSCAIPLSEEMKPHVAHYVNQPLVLGIRPQHLSLRLSGTRVSTDLMATVSMVEPFGDKLDVYLLTVDGTRLIAVLPPHTHLKTGQNVRLAVNLDRIHLFEPGETGRNILL